MPRYVSRWTVVTLLVLLLGVSLRLVWVSEIVPTPIHDAKWYVGRAKSVAAGHGISPSDRPTAYRPVGYSVALGAAYAVAGIHDSVPGRLNAAFSVLTLILLFVAARRITGSTPAARWCLLLYALYPTDIAYTSLAVSEPLFNVCMIAGVAAALSRSAWLSIGTAGLLFAAATLTRAQGIVLPIAVGLFAATRAAPRGRLLRVCLMSGALIVCLVPWWVRNYVAFQHFVPFANNGGVNLYIGNNPDATGGYRFDRVVAGKTESVVPEGWLGAGGAKEYEADRSYARLARQYILSHPWEALSRTPAKLRSLYATDHVAFGWNRKYRDAPARVYELAHRSSLYYYAFLWTLALAGFIRTAFDHGKILGFSVAGVVLACLQAVEASWLVHGGIVALVLLAGTRRYEHPWLAPAIVGAFTLLQLAYFGDARFHHAMMPWVCVSGGALLASLGFVRSQGSAGHGTRQSLSVTEHSDQNPAPALR